KQLRQQRCARQHALGREPGRGDPQDAPVGGGKPRAAARAEARGSRRRGGVLRFFRQRLHHGTDPGRRRRLVHALILLFLVTLAGAAHGDESLLLYTTTPEEYMRRLTSDFEKKHAIKVNIWRARSEAISQRVISEARAGTHAVDVIQSFGPSVEAIRREKLLRAVHS